MPHLHKPRWWRCQDNNNTSFQEIIKVREWIPHIGPLTKVIPHNLFLDIVPSSSADITRALRECFRGGSVYVSFSFVSKQSKSSNAVEMSSLIFWLQAKELRLSVCFNTFNGRLNKRQMYPLPSSNNNWMNGRKLFRQKSAKQTNAQTQAWQAKKQTVTATTATTPTSIKKRLNTQPTNLTRIWTHSVCLYCQKYPKQNM